MQLTPAEGRQILWQINEGERNLQLYQLTAERLQICEAKFTSCHVADSVSRAAYMQAAAQATHLQGKANTWQRIAIGSTSALIVLLIVQIAGVVR